MIKILEQKNLYTCITTYLYFFQLFFLTKDHIVDLGDEYNPKTKFSSHINIYVDDGQQENKYGAQCR